MKYLTPKNRAILREMVATDFKIRYQGSVLGYMWSILKPLLLFAVLYVLFTYVAPIGKGVEHYGVSLLLGIVFWNFFAETTMVGATSVVSHGDLIRKIKIPRYLVVVASSVSAFINLLLSLVVVFIFAGVNGVSPHASWLLLPIVIVEMFALAMGMALILATAYVKYRDVTYIWEVFLQAGFYASAIIVPMSIVPTNLYDWFFMNPIVQIVQDARHVLLQSANDITIWSTVVNPFAKSIPFIITLVIVTVGVMYFRKRSRYFAEDI